MNELLIGFAGICLGGLLTLLSSLIGVRQRRDEAAENSAQKTRERRLALAYSAAKLDWRQRIDLGRRGVLAVGYTLPPLSVSVIYHLVLIERLDDALAFKNLDDVTITQALHAAGHAFDVAHTKTISLQEGEV